MIRRCWSAFFKLGPATLLPVPDRRLVALQRLVGGSLATPIELAQDAPDVVLVVPHSALVRDEIADPARGPQSAGKAKRLGSPLERTLELAQLGRAESGWTPGVLGLAQTSKTRLLKLARPAADRLPMNAYRPRHLGLAESLFQ